MGLGIKPVPWDRLPSPPGSLGQGDNPCPRPLRQRRSCHIIGISAAADATLLQATPAPAFQKGKTLADVCMAGWEKKRNRSAKFLCAPVAQLWIEQWIPNPCVARSSRAGGANDSNGLAWVGRSFFLLWKKITPPTFPLSLWRRSLND